MTRQKQNLEPAAPTLSVHDVLISLFKHKWKLLLFTLLGIGGALTVYLRAVPVFESRAKLMIKWVSDASVDKPNRTSYTDIVQPEIEILTSSDLAGEVVKIVTAERIVGTKDGPANPGLAIQHISKHLEVTGVKGNNVITVVYKHTDPTVAQAVLVAIIEQYKKAHFDVHRNPDAARITEERKGIIKRELEALDKEIKVLKDPLKINSLAESAAQINGLISTTRQAMQNASFKLDAQRALVVELERVSGGGKPIESKGEDKPSIAADPLQIQEYQALVLRRDNLLQRRAEKRLGFTDKSPEVQALTVQIKELESEIAERKKKLPELTPLLASANLVVSPTFDLDRERANLLALQAEANNLAANYETVKREWDLFRDVAPRIDRLEKSKEIKEANLKNIDLKLVDAQVDVLYGPNQMPNIGMVQNPSSPVYFTATIQKVMIGLVFGGIAFGLGLVFLIEFIFDRSVRRPMELETRVGIPMLMAIPEIAEGRRLKAGKRGEKLTVKPSIALPGGVDSEVVPWQEGHFIRPFAEAIRDRLVLHFEQSGLIRKPKLVGVTGWTSGVGTSTLAGGLASALSETGDGKVLLVDMNVRGGEVHPFFKGESAAHLPEALNNSENLPTAADNLYLATATMPEAEAEIIPKRFYNLIPNFKASDYDYIIFDMPPLSKGSMTLAMAPFLDRVLLVVESEKDQRNVLQRACTELLSAKASLCGVLNKVRTYGPKWLHAGA